MPRERGEKVVATNRKARHDYLIEDTYEAGMVLSGTEVKSLRAGRASLVDGYAFIENGEAWLDAVHIPEYSAGTWTNHPPRRKRKLLLHKQEIVKISHKTSTPVSGLWAAAITCLQGSRATSRITTKSSSTISRLSGRSCLNGMPSAAGSTTTTATVPWKPSVASNTTTAAGSFV